MTTAKISFENAISFVHQRIRRKALTCAAQTLTRRLYWLMCADRIFLQEITLSSGNTLFKGTSCNLPASLTRIYHSAFDYKRLYSRFMFTMITRYQLRLSDAVSQLHPCKCVFDVYIFQKLFSILVCQLRVEQKAWRHKSMGWRVRTHPRCNKRVRHG